MRIPDRYQVKKIPGKVGKEFIREHHYSKSCHNGPMTWGLFDGEDMIGVIAFATPSSENVRASVFGPEYKDCVTELHRLVIFDDTPTNTESYFISQALKMLHEYRPHIRAVLSFADSTEGHSGVIYQAMSAWFCGTTGKATFYRDGEGRLRHPRQNGVNISKDMAAERGWVPERRGAKNRYVMFIGSPTQKRWAKRNCLLSPQPYPHHGGDVASS